MACRDCFSGGVYDHATAQGKMETLYGVSCYVASPPAESTSKSQIIYFYDGGGLNLINNKLNADRYAAETGCKVVIPDVIPGGALPVQAFDLFDTIMAPVAWTDIFGQLSRAWAFMQALVIGVPFMIRSNPAKIYPTVLKFTRDVKKDIPPGGKLGVCGFCWGGYPSTKLCAEPAEEGGSTRLIDAQFCAHPSRLEIPKMVIDAISTFKVPYAVAIGDNDMIWSIDSIHETQATLREKVGEPEEHDYEIRIYPGCHHGFATRAQKNNKVEQESQEEATKQLAAWFNKYLK